MRHLFLDLLLLLLLLSVLFCLLLLFLFATATWEFKSDLKKNRDSSEMQAGHCFRHAFAFNLMPFVSISVLLTGHHTFVVVLVGRNCSNVKRVYPW